MVHLDRIAEPPVPAGADDFTVSGSNNRGAPARSDVDGAVEFPAVERTDTPSVSG